MAYIAPIHRPQSVRHAVRANVFPGDDEECLVLAKTNRLEFWKSDRETGRLGLSSTKVIHGTITMLHRLRPRDTELDQIFIGTDRFQYFTIGWDQKTRGLTTVSNVYDNFEMYMRASQSQDQCIVDPTGRYMMLLLWEGVLHMAKMSTIKSKKLQVDWQEQIRIRELFIKSATFLHVETNQPKVAFLYQSRSDRPDAQLVTYRVYSDEKNTVVSTFDTKDQIDKMEIQDPGAGMLIPVGKGEEEHKRYIIRNAAQARAQLGGLIVVGETRLLYYDDAAKKTVEAALEEASIFVAWAEYDVSHYFVGDDYGTMWLLELVLEGGAVVTDMVMKKIGTTSRANKLLYLGSDLLFVGSHYGDSQVLKFDAARGALDLVQVLENISPVLDFTIMDMGNREGEEQKANEFSSGQARIVTGSGVHKDGSLRSVRSGVGLEDIGLLAEMENVRAMFPLQIESSPKHDTLVVSFPTETRVFRFDSAGEIEELDECKGMTLHEETLAAQNVSNGHLLQVTPSGVSLIDNEGGVVVSRWDPPADREITHASINSKRVLLSVGGTCLVSLQVSQGLTEMIRNDMGKGEHDVGESEQVACIHLPPQYPQIGAIGLWKSGRVSIVDLDTLQPLHSEPLRRKDDNASVPRDIVLAQILPVEISGPSLFVAMEDGFVITFNVSRTGFSLSARKSIVLGTRHARLQLLPRNDGLYNVFSTSEHASLIYGSQGRIIYSAVTAEEASCVCPFDADAFPGAVAVATNSLLKLSTIDDHRRTHVHTLPMEQTVRRLAYSRNERAFGLGCVKREVANGEEVITSSFKLVDEVVFDKIGKDLVLDGARGPEMVEAVMRAELTDSYGNKAERFVVGTSYLTDPQLGAESGGDIQGRILVVGIDSDRNPYLVTERNVKGASRCFAVIGDYIVAALAKTVVLYRYNETSSTTAQLDRVASYRPATYPIDLAVEGNIIAVADLMKSISLIELTPPADGEPAKLKEVGRHYAPAWATSVCHFDANRWLESDAQGNLLILERNEAGFTEDDKRRMRLTSEFRLGEIVNRARKVTVDASANAIVTPQAFLGTVEGGIYMVGTIAPDRQDLLIRFQSKLAGMLETLGDLSFEQYRAFRNEDRENEDGPYRFVDGELLERFLDQEEKLQEEICAGLGPSVEDMRDLVEELKMMH